MRAKNLLHVKVISHITYEALRPVASATFTRVSIMAWKVSGLRACGPSHKASAGRGWTSTSKLRRRWPPEPSVPRTASGHYG